MSREYSRAQFRVELANRVFKAKDLNTLFTRSNQLAENIVNRSFRWKFPNENQQIEHAKKIEKLKNCGWLPPDLAHNLKIINNVTKEYKHSDVVDDKKIESLTKDFKTPYAKIIKNKGGTLLDRFVEGIHNTLLPIHNCLIQKSDTFPIF